MIEISPFFAPVISSGIREIPSQIGTTMSRARPRRTMAFCLLLATAGT